MAACILLAACSAAGALFGYAPQCCTRAPAPGALSARRTAAEARRAAGAFRVSADERAETQTDVVDLLVVFDESARRWLAANGRGSSFAFAQARVEAMNGVLEKSRMLPYFRFRLAGAVDLAADLSSSRIEMENLLDLFVDGYGRVVAQGALAKVSDRREAVGADIVSILTARGGFGTVGVGYSLEDETGLKPFGLTAAEIVEFGDWAYNVCSIEAVDEDYTQLHEIGHNMGAGHPDLYCADWRAITLGPQLYPYSAGYYLWKEGRGYYTVMAYNFGGLAPDGTSDLAYRFEPVPVFSSPDVLWEGVPTGTAWNDNRRTLLEVCGYVSRYRAAKLPVGSSGVTEVANARAEAEWAAGAAGGGGLAESTSVAGFAVDGAFYPDRSLNGAYPYVGGVYSNGVAVGVVQLKIGRANLKKGVSKVSGTFTMMDGRRHALKSVSVPIGLAPQRVEGAQVKGLGAFSGWFGENGFAGTVAGTPYGTLQVRTEGLTGRLTSGAAHFQLGATADELSAVSDGSPRLDCLPSGEPVEVSASGAWKCRRAASLSYRGVKDAGTGEKVWTLSGLDSPRAPNRSGLRLSCAPRKSTFKGTFTLYFDVGTAERPRLKKVKAAVTGVVVGGEARGLATVRSGARWPVWIH